MRTIAPVLHLLASGPAWTDKLIAIATVIGVAGGLSALGLSLWQLRLQTRALVLQTDQDRQGLEIRLAERGLTLMQMAMDVERVAVEIPALGPYIHEGRKLPADEEKLSQVLGYATLFMGLAEAVGWQTRVNQMTWDTVSEWKRYFKALYDDVPAVQTVVNRDKEFLARETRWLFGIEPMTESIRRLELEASEQSLVPSA